jgi:hypothetical protein
MAKKIRFLAEIFGGLTFKFLYLQPLKGIKAGLKSPLILRIGSSVG